MLQSLRQHYLITYAARKRRKATEETTKEVEEESYFEQQRPGDSEYDDEFAQRYQSTNATTNVEGSQG